jgi:hypothetical protein
MGLALTQLFAKIWVRPNSAATFQRQRYAGARVEKIIVQSLPGGTISAASGGKFANGAVSAALQFAFNQALTKSNRHESRVIESMCEAAYLSEYRQMNRAAPFADLGWFHAGGQLKW